MTGGDDADEERWIMTTLSARGPENNVLRASLWSAIVDSTHTFPNLLEGGQRWNPTMAWVITPYGKVPSLSDCRSQTTAGPYTHVKSMVDPDSRNFFGH